MNAILSPIRKILQPLGIAITRPETIEGLVLEQQELARMRSFHDFLAALTPAAMTSALRMFPASKGENFQDIFAMLVLEERRNGFFVEFGATNGVKGSNSYLMEKTFDWAGILAEPARCWHAALQSNRSATISHKCVWRETGETLPFREAHDAGFSTLDFLAAKDRHAARRVSAKLYDVETITLSQLLTEHDAPTVIDYMSIDTEGSEFDILENFDFDRFRPLILTVEHNYRPEREKMIALMTAQGYVRAPVLISAYDDWFVCATLADRLRDVFIQDDRQNV
jgi:FkbM family methyltransferase